jgi:hypothetical protein
MTMWMDMKKHFAARQLEWFSAALLWAWGSYVILTPNLFHGTMAPAFQGLLAIADQEYWGYGAFLAGNIRLAALFINGQWGLTPLIRVATSFMSVFVWFWISVGLYLSHTPQTGYIVYGGLLLADMISAFRAASDAYEAEANKKLRELSEASNVTSLHRR